MPANHAMNGLRSFARRPGFTSLLVFILAIGIAFVTMVLSLAHSVFLASVPYGDPDRIVVVWRQGPEPIHQREATSYLNIRDWASGGEAFFEGLAAYTIAPSALQRTQDTVRVMVTYVDPYFFQALDVDMALGRPLTEEDNRAPAGDAVVVLGHGFWQSVLGGDPGVVGTSVNLGGHPHTVVGVMSSEDPLAPSRAAGDRYAIPEGRRGDVPEHHRGSGLALLDRRRAAQGRCHDRAGQRRHAPGVARAGGGLSRHERRDRSQRDVVLGPAHRLRPSGRCRDRARSGGRPRVPDGLYQRHDAAAVAVRRALAGIRRPSGARGRTRQFVYQALAEGVSVTLAAGALGGGLAYAGIRIFFEGNPLRMHSFAEVTMGGSVFAATLLLALATTVLFGLVPALRSARLSFHDALRPAGVGANGPERHLLRRGLVVLQVALSVAVLAGGGLVLRSLYVFTQRTTASRPTTSSTYGCWSTRRATATRRPVCSTGSWNSGSRRSRT